MHVRYHVAKIHMQTYTYTAQADTHTQVGEDTDKCFGDSDEAPISPSEGKNIWRASVQSQTEQQGGLINIHRHSTQHRDTTAKLSV